ncbi:MAG: hypothetical protein ATN34_01995 [Epulopiscium sp. Nele67-Bin002]|nr:MAG: hypothetical protein ATN34_01995 [Epulopiscium sp. Nele67-Bin002]
MLKKFAGIAIMLGIALNINIYATEVAESVEVSADVDLEDKDLDEDLEEADTDEDVDLEDEDLEDVDLDEDEDLEEADSNEDAGVAALTNIDGEFKVEIAKIMPKNDTEVYVLTKLSDERVTFYSISQDLKIFDSQRNLINIFDVNVNDTAILTIDVIGTEEYITSMTMIEMSEPVEAKIMQYSGKVVAVKGENITIYNEEFGNLTYILKENSQINLDGSFGNLDDVLINDNATIYVEGSYIVEMDIDKVVPQNEYVTQAYFESAIQTRDEFIVTVRVGNELVTYSLDLDIEAYRDGRRYYLPDIQKGDLVVFDVYNGEIVVVEAFSENAERMGRITLVDGDYITVLIDNEVETFAITENTVIYDEVLDKYILLDELPLYSEVAIGVGTHVKEEVMIDEVVIEVLGEEVVVEEEVVIRTESTNVNSLRVIRHVDEFRFSGIVQSVSSSGSEMQLLIEYDILTNTNMLVRHIEIPVSASIIIDGKNALKNRLVAGMEVIVSYRGNELYEIFVKN